MQTVAVTTEILCWWNEKDGLFKLFIERKPDNEGYKLSCTYYLTFIIRLEEKCAFYLKSKISNHLTTHTLNSEIKVKLGQKFKKTNSKNPIKRVILKALGKYMYQVCMSFPVPMIIWLYIE